MNDLNFAETESFYLEALRELGVSGTRRVGEYDIACKCPICGDSRNGNKQRLHLYKKGSVININCFNGDCSAKNMTLYKFLKTFHQPTFRKLRDFLRKRYLLQVNPEFNKPKETDIFESLSSDLGDLKDLGDLESPVIGDVGTTEIDEIKEDEMSIIRTFIDTFEKSDAETDLEKLLGFFKQYPVPAVLLKNLIKEI